MSTAIFNCKYCAVDFYECKLYCTILDEYVNPPIDCKQCKHRVKP